MFRTLVTAAAAAGLLAACSGGDQAGAARTEGPVVSTSETPRNDAVDTTPMTDPAAQTPGANSFTEAQARSAIEGAGYTAVGPLTQDAQGLWKGKATRAGAETDVSVDYKGAVTPQ